MEFCIILYTFMTSVTVLINTAKEVMKLSFPFMRCYETQSYNAEQFMVHASVTNVQF